MPFQQPALSAIRQYHFRGKTYTFPVEATMPSESDGGQLYLTVSDGYVLKTSVNESPQNQHTLDYTKQSDGSWLARDTVTLMATASSLISGTVTLRDPMGATFRMTIDIKPSLFIDESPITFDKTKPGKSTATLLTIRQQGAVTPVSLHIDPARAFTVANAKMAFVTTSGLSLTPAFEGANVIINYTPIQAGHHSARLVVDTPYGTKTISLIGQTEGLLSWLPRLPKRSIPALFAKTSWSIALPTLQRSHLLAALAFFILLGLIWGSYAFLSRSTNTVDLAILAKQPAKAARQGISSVNYEPRQANQPRQNDPLTSHEPEIKTAQRQRIDPLPLPVENIREETHLKQPDPSASDAVARNTVSQPNKEKLADYVKPTKQAKLSPSEQNKTEQLSQVKAPVASADNVSDLEQELNTPISHRGRP